LPDDGHIRGRDGSQLPHPERSSLGMSFPSIGVQLAISGENLNVSSPLKKLAFPCQIVCNLELLRLARSIFLSFGDVSDLVEYLLLLPSAIFLPNF
jgi:hypothetical protein